MKKQSVTGWIKTSDKKPKDRQNIAFVVTSDYDISKHLNGRILGGRYDAISHYFTVPGDSYEASHWRPMFEFCEDEHDDRL